jgi:hypothetical protein
MLGGILFRPILYFLPQLSQLKRIRSGLPAGAAAGFFSARADDSFFSE